jgi:hypothetical protein
MVPGYGKARDRLAGHRSSYTVDYARIERISAARNSAAFQTAYAAMVEAIGEMVANPDVSLRAAVRAIRADILEGLVIDGFGADSLLANYDPTDLDTLVNLAKRMIRGEV